MADPNRRLYTRGPYFRGGRAHAVVIFAVLADNATVLRPKT